jgi:hypothetical protein
MDGVKEEKKITNTISEESARKQLEYLFSCYDFSVDDIEDKTISSVFKQSEKKLVRKIMNGKLSIENIEGRPIVKQYMSKKYNKLGEIISYSPITAMKKIAFPREEDCRSDEHRNLKIMQILSDVSDPTAWNELEMADLSTVEILALFFRSF